VCLVGDGAFTMLMGELATLVKYQLPVKIVVLKNNTLGHIKWEQIVLEGNPQFGVDLQPIDFAAYARACGASGFTAADPTLLHKTLAEAFACAGPAVVEAAIDPNEPPMPGHVTVKQVAKFAEAMLRGERDRAAILSNVVRNEFRELI
jgi:pyruvate dehydrogenase (quinone)